MKAYVSDIFVVTKQCNSISSIDQNTFINLVNNELAPFKNENSIIGGDFNIYLNPKLDQIESMSNKNYNPLYRKNICSFDGINEPHRLF